MYASIRKGHIKPGTNVGEVISLIETGALPILSNISGFKTAYIVHGDDDTFAAISVFADQDAAEQSNTLIFDWLRQNLGSILAGSPETMVGQVVLHQ